MLLTGEIWLMVSSTGTQSRQPDGRQSVAIDRGNLVDGKVQYLYPTKEGHKPVAIDRGSLVDSKAGNTNQ